VGVSIGDQSPQAFSAKNPTGVTFSRPEQFRWKASTDADGKPLTDEETFYRQLIGAPEENAPTEGNSISSLPGKMHYDASTEDFCGALRSMPRSVLTKSWRLHANINRMCCIHRVRWAEVSI